MYHAGLHWYDLYFLIVSLWLVGTSQIKVSALQEGVSGTWKVSQCQLKFTSYLSISLFWYYSLLLFADAEKITHNYTTSYLLFFFFFLHSKQKRRCQEETMVLIHTFLWQIKMLMAMLTDLQTVTVYLLHISNVKKHLLWKVLVLK